MALVTRNVTNAGDEIYTQEGGVPPGFEVSFQLCDANGAAINCWDSTSGELVVSRTSKPAISAAGEFTQALWPNDRGEFVTYYRCATNSDADEDRLITISSGAGDLSWKALMLASLPIP